MVERQAKSQSNGLIAALRPRELSRESLSTAVKDLSTELAAVSDDSDADVNSEGVPHLQSCHDRFLERNLSLRLV